MTDTIIQGAGVGYKDEDGTICMTRCFKCGRENYALNVSSGTCAFCGYDPNKEKKDEAEIVPSLDSQSPQVSSKPKL